MTEQLEKEAREESFKIPGWVQPMLAIEDVDKYIDKAHLAGRKSMRVECEERANELCKKNEHYDCNDGICAIATAIRGIDL